MTSFKNLLKAGVLLSVPAFAAPAMADMVPFDINGAGAGGTVGTEIGAFDFKPGNALAQGALDADPLNFTQLFQAKLTSFLDEEGNVVATPDSGTEFTAVAKFEAFGPSSAFFLKPGDTSGFVRFFFDASADSNDLAGTGFTDGELILEAQVVAANGTFLPTGTTSKFDQFGADNFPGVGSITGTGGLTLEARVTFANSDFFLLTAPERISLAFADTGTTLPFRNTNPSKQFFDGSTPNIGSLNGVTGTDVQLQTDATASFAVVPTPDSVKGGLACLMVLGSLKGYRLARSRRQLI